MIKKVTIVNENILLKQYVDLALEEDNILSIGSFGEYLFLDMDVSTKEAKILSTLIIKLNSQ